MTKKTPAAEIVDLIGVLGGLPALVFATDFFIFCFLAVP
jgi:hypothetical protein